MVTPTAQGRSGERQTVQAESDPERLELGRMVPGRYLVAALPDPDVTSPTDPRVLEKLRKIAVPVTLVAGQMAKVALTVGEITR